MSTLRQRRAAEALKRAQRALREDPREASAWLEAAEAMIALGHESDAQQALEQLLKLEPGHAEGWLRVGVLHSRAGRTRRAVAAFERATSQAPGWAEAWMRLGTSTFRSGDIRGAEAPLRQALALDPALWPAAVALASVLERSRRYDEATMLLEPLAGQAAPPATVAMTWAGLQRRLKRPASALDCVEASLDVTAPGQERALLLHAYGDLLDDLGRHADAFAAFDAGNRGRGFGWDAATHSQRVDRVLQAFTPRALARSQRAGVDCSRAVLIVGMPRSGTTLLEQILSGHSALAGAGELDTLRRIGQRVSAALGAPRQWFHQPERVDRALLDQCAEAYLGALKQRAGAAPRITDKMPDNHLQLGLASQMLPGCRVIHMVRDPLDTCWSCFRQPFAQGLAWSCRQADIVAYYRDYRRSMGHWGAVLELPVLELAYEDLVSQPEASLGRVLAFLGLEHEPACLEFHRSERLVSTASHAQVQEPLHRQAVGRAAPYRPWLQTIVAGLEAP